MSKLDQLEADLGYVRDAVRKSERERSPKAIYLLWAGIALLGFALVDFSRPLVGPYWAVAGPLGGAISFWLGWREGRSRGQLNREIGVRHALHWLAMMVAIWLTIPLAIMKKVDWEVLNPIILLIIALGWFLAGVHLDRPLRWLGLLMAAGYVGVLFVPVYAWTLLGLLVAAGLVTTAFLTGRERG